MLSLDCNNVLFEERPIGVANLLKTPVGEHCSYTLPFGDSNDDMFDTTNSLRDYSTGVGLPMGLIHKTIGIDTATLGGVDDVDGLAQQQSRECRRFNIHTASAQCIGNEPIQLRRSALVMNLFSKHLNSQYIYEAQWDRYLKEGDLVELLAVYEAVCPYISEYVAPPTAAQVASSLPSTTFSLLCGASMHPSDLDALVDVGVSPFGALDAPTIKTVLAPQLRPPPQLTLELVQTIEIAILLALGSVQYLVIWSVSSYIMDLVLETSACRRLITLA
jgi:hypothetical protein